MTLQPKYAGRNVTKEEVKRDGYVKGGLTYAVLDDLSIVPLTASLASISLLDKLGHRDLSLLEQKTVLYVQAEVSVFLLLCEYISEWCLFDVEVKLIPTSI